MMLPSGVRNSSCVLLFQYPSNPSVSYLKREHHLYKNRLSLIQMRLTNITGGAENLTAIMPNPQDTCTPAPLVLNIIVKLDMYLSLYGATMETSSKTGLKYKLKN